MEARVGASCLTVNECLKIVYLYKMTDAFLCCLWPSLGKAHESCPRLKSQDIKVYKAHCPKKNLKATLVAKPSSPPSYQTQDTRPFVYFSQLNAHKKGLCTVPGQVSRQG